ncbi:hypothetical protein [Chondrinema litorale]|uniref:hypothetical protein n=1 Tax=Chondrinema litorale TaxID=2994555 RepID=UPI002543440A|nr:hypothetical protein [Chondrinema litorale]UZR99558.1 hypothetical protein OQ292_37475 [Chondrinema litorale]
MKNKEKSQKTTTKRSFTLAQRQEIISYYETGGRHPDILQQKFFAKDMVYR